MTFILAMTSSCAVETTTGMIVGDVRDGIVYCVWMLNGAVVRGSFPIAALQHSE